MVMASLVAIGRYWSLLSVVMVAITGVIPIVQGAPRVNYINPRIGSLRGATRVTIYGEDFSKDAFSYGAGNEDKGDKVYFKNSTTTVECDVLPYWSNQAKIVCDTRAASDGVYTLLLFVDGKEISTQGGSYCKRDDRCQFTYRESRTPYVWDVTPMTGTPGTEVNIYGRLFTDLYASSQNAKADVEDFNTDDPIEIQRVYWGNYIADVIDPDTDEPYGIALDNDGTSQWGNMIVVPQGTFVESQKFHFLISGSYGRSQAASGSLRLSGQNKLYNYQTHAEITGVEPSSGSLEGGTLLTISGNYFYALADMKVLVGGVPCDIQNISDTVILCITNKAPDAKSTYPGSRGMLWEIWSNFGQDLSFADWDTNSSLYSGPQVQTEAKSPESVDDGFVARLRGYFVPPRDGDYRFLISSDDGSQLFMDTTGNGTNLTMIAESPTVSGRWTRYEEQTSAKLTLVGGVAYYMEARYKEWGGGDYVEVGFEMYDAPVTYGVIDGAYNEEQQIRVGSTLQGELQSLTVVGTQEVQEVKILYFGCNETDIENGDCNPVEYFTITYNGNTTGEIFVNSTAEEVAQELNNLTTIPENVTVSVSLEQEGANYTYTITFDTNEDLPLLTVEANDTILVETEVREVSPGSTAVDTSFVLDYGGVQSSTAVSTTSTADEVKAVLLDMFSVGCQRTSSAAATFSQDFEVELQGGESGTRVVDTEPFCGRTSLKNPYWLYEEGQTKKDNGDTVNAFRVDFTSKLCFAFKGKISTLLQLTLRYVDKKFNEVTNHAWYVASELDQYDGYTDSWEHTCIDLNTMVTTQGWIVEDALGAAFYVTRIGLPNPDANRPLYIDNVFIGGSVDSYQRTKAPARPNGLFVVDVNVIKNDLGFDISMTPGSCGYGFPLLGFRDASVEAGSAELDSDEVVYSSSDFATGANIQVMRVMPATVPLSGTFVLESDGREVEVSATASAKQMKEALELWLDTGSVVVYREGNCYGYQWNVEWTSKGGSQPLLQVNDTGVLGTGIMSEVERAVEGRLFMAPIPGEFLRTPHDTPQVEVMVNHIPSICHVNASCSFSYDNESTPQITSISPTSGSAYVSTAITISGSGFSDDVAENNVTIGGVVCDVTSASATSLDCDVGPGQIGNFTVLVNVESKGLAAHPNGNVTFEYDAGITGVDPTSGSTAGGTQITISGYGFPCDDDDDVDKNVLVTVGDKTCKIMSVCYDEIICKIALGSVSRRRRSATTADIVVVIENIVAATGSDLFTFDDSLTVTISSISPNTSNVLGGGNLTITGSGFNSSGATVTIGDTECELFSKTNTEVICAIPGHSPGSYDIEMSVANKGFADTSAISQFEYLLEVTSINPEVGSLEGGTTVIITGAGFGTDDSEVSIEFSDSIICDVQSIADDRIECVISIEPTVINVDNQGKHESYGQGYKWNPQFAEIGVGDIVHWQWAVPTYVTGLAYTVQQTANGDATDYDGSGFYAGPKTTDGSYAYRFTAPGIYYYSSGPVNSNNLVMKGIIKVVSQPSAARKLSLFVGDYEAKYITDSGVSASSGGPCSPHTDAIANCTTPQPSNNDSSSFYFAFWDCATPVVTDISPNTGTPSTVIGITGYGFGEETCQNIIKINDHECVASFANSTYIECDIDTNNTLPVGNYDTVYLNVLNQGDAVNSITTPVGRTFRMFPSITGLSQDHGSSEGGTRLVIYGDGFSAAMTSDIGVAIGGAVCVVESVNYTAVTCVTGKPAGASTYQPVITINNVEAICEGNCSYTYSASYAPIVTSVTPNTTTGPKTTININGTDFGNDVTSVTITVGGVDCIVTSASDDEIVCDVGYVPVGNASLVVNIAGLGDSAFSDSEDATMWSLEDINSIDPSSGSIEGGQVLTITGNGFHDDDTSVDIGNSECVILNLNISEIECITPSHSAGIADLVVTSSGLKYPAKEYTFAGSDTPTVSSVSPTSGISGDSITISGTGFSSTTSDNTVTIDGVECSVTSAGPSSIGCDVGVHSAGTYTIVVHVQGKGYATSSTVFDYSLTISSTSPSQGSFGGGPNLEINGTGFGAANDTVVTVCDNVCDILNITTSYIECDVPINSGDGSTELDCDIVVTLESGAVATEANAWQYREDLTPVIEMVDPPRGGTGGGTTLTITGTGFASSGNKVYIAGTACTVNSESTTDIVCRTGAHSPSEKTSVRVEVPNKGIAVRENASYYYVDVWSSVYTWGGNYAPIEGDFVVVPAGQTLLLDTDTPILKMLLIQGGSVIFDEADITLNSEYILIVDDGLLQVGTEEEPFQHHATIMLHGHVRSKELPLYGAKTLAVRHGTLELHGKPIPVTWTYLAQSISAGDTQMTLMKSVTWEVGDQIVIAATGHRHSQRENEMLTITDVSEDGLTLTFEPAVQYDHISIEQTIDGVYFETRAEVGLLTRNVVVRGSVHEKWTETVEACPELFDTNQFATQTCFLGRFGEEIASDQYGAAIMLSAREPDQHLSTGHIEYVEVTHAGQAFRLGRYAIHFHLNGNITGNYVRGCAIHHTFNRAVTVHAVHHLLIEYNVAYNVMGHAYFLEDGIETKNIIQYNLAIFVRPSSSLLNVDVTPAAYWVTNADNYIRHNAAAGGSHFGFWYNAPTHPGGPSFTTSVCPRNVPVLEFYNNTAHTVGWYGIWIFPVYYPTEGGACGGNAAPAEFYNLTAWEVERGAEGVEVGRVRFNNFLIADAEASGIEFQTTQDAWGGPLVKDSVIIGWSALSEDNKAGKCTSAGLHLPKSKFLTADNVKFINFDQDRCAAIRACAHCKVDQGGFQSRFQNIQYYNSPHKTHWKWQHECWLEDLDGTLTGQSSNYSVLPYNPNLPPDHCDFGDSQFGTSSFPGAVCDDTVTFHRMAFNQAAPSSLRYKRTIFTNEHGTSYINYHKKRITHSEGWMITLVDGDNYRFFFEDRDHLTNISYAARFDDFKDRDFVLLNHNFTQRPDAFALTGDIRNGTDEVPTYSDDNHADWHFDNDTRIFTYLISGKGRDSVTNLNVNLDVYRCFYKDCIPPVPTPPPEIPNISTNITERPANVSYWSNIKTWKNAPEGWGGNNGSGTFGLPQDGDDVIILPGTYVVADTDLPVMKKLFIYGTLELDDTRDYNLTATYILIQGGRLIIGWSESKPFTHNVHITLQGNHLTPDIPLPNGPNLGSKALGSFGGLELHGKNHSVYWTHLETSVSAGDSTLTVMEDTDWEEGDEIVVTTTSYESWHTETFTIVGVTDSRTFVLNATFQHDHSAGEHTVTDGEETYTYGLRAEVGLLTRNIKIEGADYEDLIEESFGARVVVGRFFQDGEMYQGYASISNVEFYHSGQEGWTDFYDPRYSLAFLDASPSSVTGCSFHSGFSPAIGLFGTHGITVKDNIIHHTVGSGIIDYSIGNTYIHNLVMVSIFPGTYLDRNEPENLDTNAGFDVESATNPILINNTVAGSERTGFKIKGESCQGETSWSGNVVHSVWMCVYMMSNLNGCTKVANFEIYKCASYGIYAQITSSLHVTDVIMADNKVSILPLIIGPRALSHQTSDKFVRIENSLIVAMSPDYDCGGEDEITPEAAGLPKSHPSPKASGGGHVGLLWTTFMSSHNGAPFKPFNAVKSYPAISGINYIDNVMFVNFKSLCGKNHKVIMTNPASGDFMHPIWTSNIRMVDVANDNLLHLHRPSLGLVNPSDCVDMDCDAMKKAMIRDLDGSLLGSVGTVVPQSEFEWDGDARRGLGYYRVPPVMVTNQDGSRIAYSDKMPNKGIYRGHNKECEWKSAWTAYECHGLDHMLMVVESLDGDSEVRRVSPVALFSDTYIDLINGPQDHGWCHGYTCQERISTFYTVVNTGQEYELVFSGTNPQRLRYHLMNANDTQKVVVGTWYANPQRLDVYVNGMYVMPNNGAIEGGEFVWKNDLTPEEYKPSADSEVYGENFFDRDAATLYINIKGSLPIDVVTTPVVMVTFGIPAITIDSFFEENLINNLVQFLDVEPSQIRIVDVIAEDSKRRRRRAAGEAEVVVEVGDAPASSIETDSETATGTPATTITPPTTAASSGGGLDYDKLVDIQSTLANEMQSGSLGESLDIQITSLAMTDPEPTPFDPTGGVRATNETGGPANGTTTYAEQQAAEAEEEEASSVVSVVYRVPTQLVVYMEPSSAVEGHEFNVQPKIQVLDALGVIVDQLGTKANPWQLTASIQAGSGSASAELLGNVTLPFIDGWVNFTSLAIDVVASDFILDFNITYPNTSSLAVSSQAFGVEGRTYYAAVATAPDVVNVNETFGVVVEVRDEHTMLAATDLADKNFVWQAIASLHFPSSYSGELVGDVNVTFDLATAQAHFSNLSINAAGYQYIIEVHVMTMPSSENDFTVLLDPFDVQDPDVIVHTGEPSTLTITFDADYSTIVNGNENAFKANFLNNIAPMYPNVTFSNVVITEGSILVTFDIQGDVESTVQLIWDDLEDGHIALSFNGYSLVADQMLVVNGEQYDPNLEVAPGSTLPIWVIPVVVCIAIVLIVIIVLILWTVKSKSNDKIGIESMPLQPPPDKNMMLESMVCVNKGFDAPAICLDSPGSTSSSEPELRRLTDEAEVTTTRELSLDVISQRSKSPSLNSPRRTPEVQVVTAYPPGFAEDQEERVLEDRQRMYLMAKNQDGTFLKLGTISVNQVGSVYDLRQDIINVLSDDLREKKFVLMKETLKDIDGSLEKKLSVSEVYSSDCVLVRFVNDDDASKMCVCGLVGQFDCSLCHRQAYCSPQCQSKDWPRHTIVCRNWKTMEQKL